MFNTAQNIPHASITGSREGLGRDKATTITKPPKMLPNFIPGLCVIKNSTNTGDKEVRE